MKAEKPKLSIIDIWSPYCPPCKAMEPIIDKISKEFEEVEVKKLNAVENFELVSKYGIKMVPTILFLKDGKLVDSSVGAMTEAELENKIRKHI